MQYQAYVVGLLKRDALGAWVLTSIDVYSESAWQLTQMHNDRVFSQLAPPYTGASFAVASAAAYKDTERHYPQLKHLFRWAR